MIFISNAAYRLPGLGKAENHGQLVTTQEIIRHLNAKKPDGSLVEDDLIEKIAGFHSLSLTNTTINFIREYIWNDAKQINPETIYRMQDQLNEDLYQMLEDSIQQLFSNHFHAKKLIKRHIHLDRDLIHLGGYYLGQLRKKLELPENIFTEFTWAGCPSINFIIHQLNQEKVLEERYILITCNLNCLSTAHQYRALSKDKENNINYWSRNALFGEGVGALLIHQIPDEVKNEPYEFKLIDSQLNLLLNSEENAWRSKPDQDGRTRLLNVKEIKGTYFPALTKMISQSCEKLKQLKSYATHQELLDKILAFGIHESNYRWLETMALNEKIPFELIPSVSKKAGTPGALSPVITLSEAMEKSVKYPERSLVIHHAVGQLEATLLSGYFILERLLR